MDLMERLLPPKLSDFELMSLMYEPNQNNKLNNVSTNIFLNEYIFTKIKLNRLLLCI